MEKQKWFSRKKLIFLIIFLILILSGIIIYNVFIPKKTIDNPYVPEVDRVKDFNGEQIDVDGVIDGDMDTVEEYQFILQSAHGQEGCSFVYVAETDTTITFHLVRNSDNSIVEIYVMDKQTLESTVSVPDTNDKNLKDSN